MLATDLASRRLVDHPEVFAVEDAGDFPIKQASCPSCGRTPPPTHGGDRSGARGSFDPVGMCVTDLGLRATSGVLSK